MELTKRSNFKLDLTTVPVTVKKGLKAIDFVGAIATEEDPSEGKSFGIISAAVDRLDGTVLIPVGPIVCIYDPATGQITEASSSGGSGSGVSNKV